LSTAGRKLYKVLVYLDQSLTVPTELKAGPWLAHRPCMSLLTNYCPYRCVICLLLLLPDAAAAALLAARRPPPSLSSPAAPSAAANAATTAARASSLSPPGPGHLSRLPGRLQHTLLQLQQPELDLLPCR